MLRFGRGNATPRTAQEWETNVVADTKRRNWSDAIRSGLNRLMDSSAVPK